MPRSITLTWPGIAPQAERILCSQPEVSPMAFMSSDWIGDPLVCAGMLMASPTTRQRSGTRAVIPFRPHSMKSFISSSTSPSAAGGPAVPMRRRNSHKRCSSITCECIRESDWAARPFKWPTQQKSGTFFNNRLRSLRSRSVIMCGSSRMACWLPRIYGKSQPNRLDQFPLHVQLSKPGIEYPRWWKVFVAM